MQEFNSGRVWKFELQRSRGVAIAILRRRCLMGRLLLRCSVRLIGLVDQLSVHISLWQDGDHRGRESEETIVDRSTDFASGCSVSVEHRGRSLLLSFSTCCLGISGLGGAINCILARTSHQRTTSEKRTKALLPKCPLFGGSTLIIRRGNYMDLRIWN